MKYIKNFKIALVDDDYVVRAKVDYVQNAGEDDPLTKFIKEVEEELIPGQRAHLEIKGFDIDPITFEISRFE